MIPFLLIIIGLFLILLEFYLPGGLIGVLGGLAILSGFILLFLTENSTLVLSLYLVGTLIALGLVVKLALYTIRKTKKKASFYSDDTQENFQAVSFDREALQKSAIVDSDLKPGGHILLEGKRREAISIDGYIPKGSNVIIIGGQGESLIVKKEPKEPS